MMEIDYPQKVFWWISIIVLSVFICCQRSQKPSLSFTHIYDPFSGLSGQINMDWINQRLAQFQQAHPGLELELEQVKWDQIDTKIMADFRAGIRHDVVITSPQFLPKHAVIGDLLDLAPYLNWRADEVAEFSWNPVWQACQQQGKLIGIPLGAHTRLCIYYRDMFVAAGLDPDRPPQTLEELIEYARRLTRDTDGDGKIDVWGLGIYFGPSRATIELTFAPLLWHFGGTLWDEETKQAAFASPAGFQAARFLSDLINTYQVTPRWVVSGTMDDVVLRPFLDGKFAMAWGWGSYWIQALQEKGLVENCFPPTPQARMTRIGLFLTPTAVQAQFTNAWTISVHALTRDPIASVQFIENIIQPDALAAFPDGGLPSHLSNWQKPEYQNDFYRIWFEATRKGRSMPATAHYEELANAVAAALQEILVKQAPIEQTLQKFQRAYNIRYAGE
ncbi:MAG: extracellular solute-binding protein [candidate division KSB1 bacterium]|nr:extracellular solute-binding protein [candidate division KSB1 bacterium]